MTNFTIKLTFLFLLILLLASSASASTINKSPNYLISNTGLVGYWTMDGSKVNWATGAVTDSSGKGNTGTITNMATSTGVAIGKIGQALNFDGVDDYVNAGNASSLMPTSVSVTAWARASSYLSNYGRIVEKGGVTTGGGYSIEFDSNLGAGDKTFYGVIWNASSATRISPSDTVALNRWYFLTLTFDAGTAKMYIDAVEKSSTSGLTMTSNTGSLFIGATSESSGTEVFPGLIDDVRVYNRALSAKEIQTLYNIGATTKFNVSPTKYLTDGLVGYWTMDGSKVNWATGAVTDSSGKGNTGTITNMATSTGVAIGKIGQALNFDGVDDYVSAPLDTANIVTVSVWAKMNKSASGDFNFVTQDGGTSGRLSTGWNGVEQFYIAKSGIAYHKLTNVYSLSAYNNSWHHIVFVYNSDNTQSRIYVDGIEASYAAASSQTITSDTTVYIGREGTLYTNGLIDEVRVYNRALSAKEIQTLYNIGATTKFNVSPTKYLTDGLVGYWTMDGSKVNWKTGAVTDSSGRGNTGTIKNMATSTGVAIGKIGQALNFDGVNDVVTVTDGNSLDLSTALSISMWVYPRAVTVGYSCQLTQKASATTDSNWNFYYFGTTAGADLGKIQLNGTAGGTWSNLSGKSTNTLPLNTWTHVTATYTSGSGALYIDGIQNATSVTTGSLANNAQNVLIAQATNAFSGGGDKYCNAIIDEVRIYNRALSADEIQKLYNAGR